LRLTGENITIARRFRGPAASANGGYASGRLAAYLEGTAEVTLRSPPPLDRPLAVERRDERVVLLDRDVLVAEAESAEVDVEPPARPTLAEAEDAATRHVRWGGEAFNECFTCGERPRDGLSIHVGKVEGRNVHAAPWTAREVASEIVWAAIDCPGAYAIGSPGRGELVLGRMAAEIVRLPREGEQCIVVAWPLGEDRRKLYAGTALLAADGELLARARQTWIAPRARDFVADSN